MKYFFADLMHMCSAENTTSRGFYLAMTIGSLLAIIVTAVLFVMALIGKLVGTAAMLSYAAFPIVIVLVVALGVWLAKQE